MAVIVTYTNDYGDSIEFSKNSDIRITAIDGLSANNIDLSEATVTNQVGSSITGASIQSKTMTIDGRYFYTPAIRKRLLAVILPGVSARLRYQNTVENVDVYWEGQPTATPDISTSPVWQSFQFSLKLPYPYPRTTEEENKSFSYLQSGFRFPQAYSSKTPWQISIRIIEPLQTIANRGDIPAGFTVTFKALTDGVKGPKLLNVDTRENIAFTQLTLNSGDVLTVNTMVNSREVLLTTSEGTKNAFEYMDYDSTFFLLARGANTLRYSAQEKEASLEVTLSFEESLAGV